MTAKIDAKVMQDSPLFEGLTYEELNQFIELAEIEEFAAGDEVITEADQGDCFYYVQRGRLEVQIQNILKRTPLLLNVIKDGEVFGEMILLGKRRRTASVTVRNPSTLVVWKDKDVLSHFESNQHVGYVVMTNLAKMVSDRLLDMNLQLRNHTELLGTGITKFV